MVKSIVVFEPDLQSMRIKANSLSNLFAMIRTYSNKMFTHMQIFAHLINDLTDSEDRVEIKTSKLHYRTLESSKYVSKENDENDKLKDMISRISIDNKTLNQKIDVDIKNTEELKDFFNKALGQINEKLDI